MLAIEQSSYRPLQHMSARQGRAARNDYDSSCCCGCLPCCMWLINCFRNLEQEQRHNRPVAVLDSRAVQYQAPSVTPPARVASISSCDDDIDHEQGTLLPKRRSPDPHPHPVQPAPAASSDEGALTPPGHHRTGSGASSRSRPDSSPYKPPKASGSSKAMPGKAYNKAVGPLGGSLPQSAVSAGLRELLGSEDEDEDEDFCPTCLEVYDTGNPKIWTRCGHHFHMPCIYEWLERKETCPICESKMVFEEDVIM